MNWTRHDTRALIEAAAERPRISIGAVKTIRRHRGEDGLVERMARLETFVSRTNSVAFIWGKADCSLLVADWIAENGHPDPAEDWRGTYNSESTCRALLAARGGLAAHVADCAAQIRLRPLHEPEFGCIAVIGSTRSPDRQWAAIWQGHRWLVKWGDERSAKWVHFAAKPLNMWRV